MQKKLENMAKLLLEKRKEEKLTQKEVADKLVISPNYYSELERGDKLPSTDVLFKISEFYNITFSKLFGEESGHHYIISNNPTKNGEKGGAESLNNLVADLLKSKDENIDNLKIMVKSRDEKITELKINLECLQKENKKKDEKITALQKDNEELKKNK